MDLAPLEGNAMKIMIKILIGLLFFSGTLSHSRSTKPENQQYSIVIVVVGASGTPEYAEQFAKWASLGRKLA
jgi:hypothetical protein